MLNRLKEGLTEKVTFEQKPEGSEAISLAGRTFQIKGTARAKPKGRTCLVFSRHSDAG